ncbi:TetR family transcriptional regulator [Streptomyces misionensis]|uniref:TetR family transcriptional regulator n=1 Tax=Streptomyces misionensis TaxID=67331 RepID=A0A5C6JXU8_9ACTN|nr:TetR/AcrR family transcriptional regulator [Streptomyces misionensis]TWV55520.1 TetR family transcriptional regulator [Streptomyces misionensis]
MPRVSMREEIIDAAVDTFHARGFHGTGVKDITDAAGVPKGSLYNHFASKEEIAVEAIRRYGAARRLSELTRPGTPALDRLRAHFESLRDEVVRLGIRRGCLLGNFGAEAADHHDAIRATLATGLGRWRAAIAEVIGQAQQEGTVRAQADAETLAGFILNAWEGTLIGARVERHDQAFAEFFTVVFGDLLR